MKGELTQIFLCATNIGIAPKRQNPNTQFYPPCLDNRRVTGQGQGSAIGQYAVPYAFLQRRFSVGAWFPAQQGEILGMI